MLGNGAGHLSSAWLEVTSPIPTQPMGNTAFTDASAPYTDRRRHQTSQAVDAGTTEPQVETTAVESADFLISDNQVQVLSYLDWVRADGWT